MPNPRVLSTEQGSLGNTHHQQPLYTCVLRVGEKPRSKVHRQLRFRKKQD